METAEVLVDPSQFTLLEFCERNASFIVRYVELRARGYHESVAFRRVFGAINSQDNLTQRRIDNLENNPYVVERFEARLKTIPTSEMLNERLALNWLVRLANSPHAKETTRLAAMRDAAILAGITVIDDEGKTRKRPTLADFYKGRANQTLPPSPPDEADKPTALH